MGVFQFGLLYLNGGKMNDRQLVPQEWVSRSLSRQVHAGENYDYSYGWWVTEISGYDVFKAWGYGGQYVCLIPQLNILIVSTADTRGNTYNEFDMDSFIEAYVLPAVQE